MFQTLVLSAVIHPQPYFAASASRSHGQRPAFGAVLGSLATPMRKLIGRLHVAPRPKLTLTEAGLLNLTLGCHSERHSQARRVSETGQEKIMRATSARQENLLIIQTLQEQIAWAIRCRAMSLA